MIHTYMSIRKTNFIKPQRVQVEPVSIIKNRPAQPVNNVKPASNRMSIDEKRERMRQVREKQEIHKQRKQVEVATKVNRPVHDGIHAPGTAKKYSTIPKIWNGDTVYIVAGGASLAGFNFDRLNGKNVIAINKAFMYVKNPTVLYWTDTRFYNWYKNEIDSLKTIKITASHSGRYLADDVTLIKNAGSGRTMDLGSQDRLTTGNNSGLGAIGLAIKMGAKKIYLLGYDMGHTAGKSHFHDGYPAGGSRDHIYKGMIRQIEDNDAMLNSMAQIFNTNPKSNLRCFNFTTLDQALIS